MQLAAVLGLTPEEWSAIAQMLIGLGVVAGGCWALFNHRHAQRQEAVRWLHGVFKDFYLGARFDGVRHLLEYDSPYPAGPLLERRIHDRSSPVTVEEMELLQALDTLLAYFEHILYLEERGQISPTDRASVCGYWFDIMSHPDRPSLLRYVRHFGWARVRRELERARSTRAG